MLLPTAPSFVLMALVGASASLPAGAIMALPASSRAARMGVFFTWYCAGMALLTPVGGVLRDVSGASGAPFAGALELAAVGVLAVLRGVQRRCRTLS